MPPGEAAARLVLTLAGAWLVGYSVGRWRHGERAAAIGTGTIGAVVVAGAWLA